MGGRSLADTTAQANEETSSQASSVGPVANT